MATAGDDMIISKVLEQIEKYAYTEYTTLNKDLRKKLSEAVKQMASSQQPSFSGGGRDFPTFKMEIERNRQQVYSVKMSGMEDGKKFETAKQLAAPKDVDWALHMQMASIIVDTVTLALKAVNVGIPLHQAKMREIIMEVAAKLEKGSEILGGVGVFIKAWKKHDSVVSRAKALFVLLQTIFKVVPKILWDIFKGLLGAMQLYDWVLACARLIALIITGTATGGAALAVKIATNVLDAADFALKIANITELESIMGKLK